MQRLSISVERESELNDRFGRLLSSPTARMRRKVDTSPIPGLQPPHVHRPENSEILRGARSGMMVGAYNNCSKDQ